MVGQWIDTVSAHQPEEITKKHSTKYHEREDEQRCRVFSLCNQLTVAIQESATAANSRSRTWRFRRRPSSPAIPAASAEPPPRGLRTTCTSSPPAATAEAVAILALPPRLFHSPHWGMNDSHLELRSLRFVTFFRTFLRFRRRRRFTFPPRACLPHCPAATS